MYNAIGLTTPRGSGTNGYVQRNWATLPPVFDNKTHVDDEKLDISLRKPNKEILDHENKRKIELKCMEFEQMLEDQGYGDSEIAKKVDAYRLTLMPKQKTEQPVSYEPPVDEHGRIIVKETHEIAEAQQKKNEKLRTAFGISEYFVEGSSFDPARRAKEAATRAAAAAVQQKKYTLVRTPSPSSSLVMEKEKRDNITKEKRQRSSSASEEGVKKKNKKKKKKEKRKRSVSSVNLSDGEIVEETKHSSKSKQKKHKNEQDSVSSDNGVGSDNEIKKQMMKKKKKSKRNKPKEVRDTKNTDSEPEALMHQKSQSKLYENHQHTDYIEDYKKVPKSAVYKNKQVPEGKQREHTPDYRNTKYDDTSYHSKYSDDKRKSKLSTEFSDTEKSKPTRSLLKKHAKRKSCTPPSSNDELVLCKISSRDRNASHQQRRHSPDDMLSPDETRYKRVKLPLPVQRSDDECPGEDYKAKYKKSTSRNDENSRKLTIKDKYSRMRSYSRDRFPKDLGDKTERKSKYEIESFVNQKRGTYLEERDNSPELRQRDRNKIKESRAKIGKKESEYSSSDMEKSKYVIKRDTEHTYLKDRNKVDIIRRKRTPDLSPKGRRFQDTTDKYARNKDASDTDQSEEADNYRRRRPRNDLLLKERIEEKYVREKHSVNRDRSSHEYNGDRYQTVYSSRKYRTDRSDDEYIIIKRGKAVNEKVTMTQNRQKYLKSTSPETRYDKCFPSREGAPKYRSRSESPDRIKGKTSCKIKQVIKTKHDVSDTDEYSSSRHSEDRFRGTVTRYDRVRDKLSIRKCEIDFDKGRNIRDNRKYISDEDLSVKYVRERPKKRTYSIEKEDSVKIKKRSVSVSSSSSSSTSASSSGSSSSSSSKSETSSSSSDKITKVISQKLKDGKSSKYPSDNYALLKNKITQPLENDNVSSTPEEKRRLQKVFAKTIKNKAGYKMDSVADVDSKEDNNQVAKKVDPKKRVYNTIEKGTSMSPTRKSLYVKEMGKNTGITEDKLSDKSTSVKPSSNSSQDDSRKNLNSNQVSQDKRSPAVNSVGMSVDIKKEPDMGSETSEQTELNDLKSVAIKSRNKDTNDHDSDATSSSSLSYSPVEKYPERYSDIIDPKSPTSHVGNPKKEPKKTIKNFSGIKINIKDSISQAFLNKLGTEAKNKQPVADNKKLKPSVDEKEPSTIPLDEIKLPENTTTSSIPNKIAPISTLYNTVVASEYSTDSEKSAVQNKTLQSVVVAPANPIILPLTVNDKVSSPPTGNTSPVVKNRSFRKRTSTSSSSSSSSSSGRRSRSIRSSSSSSSSFRSNSVKRSRKRSSSTSSSSVGRKRSRGSRSLSSDYRSKRYKRFKRRSYSRSRSRNSDDSHYSSRRRYSRSRSSGSSKSCRRPYRSRSRSYSYSSSSSRTRSRSMSIPRRRGSPSFLDRRRITSARKRPIPYLRVSSTSPDRTLITSLSPSPRTSVHPFTPPFNIPISPQDRAIQHCSNSPINMEPRSPYMATHSPKSETSLKSKTSSTLEVANQSSDKSNSYDSDRMELASLSSQSSSPERLYRTKSISEIEIYDKSWHK